MNRHVLDQVPLWVEGDLDPSELAAVDTHLDQCPECREAAERLRQSQAWLREAMASPFDASDQERLRQTVMEQIRAEATPRPVRRFVTRPALLAACAATLLMATLTWRQTHSVVPPSSSDSRPSLPPALPPAAEDVAQAHSTPVRAAPLHATRVPEVVLPPPREEPARIEIQTPNPNVRIIWLAQAKPLPDTSPFHQEAP